MIVAIALLLVISLSGVLTRMPKESRFLLPSALLLTIIQTTIGMLFFALNMWILSETGWINWLLSGWNSFFLVILLIAFVDGLLLYGITYAFFKRISVDKRIFTLSEYIIQWGLIYITVYQVMYDSIFPQLDMSMLKEFSVNQPNELMIGILPSLISVWVAVIMYKVKERQL